jgi:integrative and conjugative element protein (TIGR02256 family)
MHLLLTQAILKRLEYELWRARRREIGGLLLGEHLQDEVFRVVEITIQRSGGSEVHFVRDPARHKDQLEEFFRRTGGEYAKFNYLGEWHSHPSFEPHPSVTDIRTMQSIVEDRAVGVNFLVMVIVTLQRRKQIKLSALLFRPRLAPGPVEVSIEPKADIVAGAIGGWWKRLVRR